MRTRALLQRFAAAHEGWPRFVVLVVTSVVGMCALGLAAYITAVRGDLSRDRGLIWAVLIVATVVGLFSMPAAVGFLKEADLPKSLATIYGVSLVATVVWAALMPWIVGLSAAVPAFLSVVIMSRWCGNHFPIEKAPPARRFCPKCNYDLRDRFNNGCPECGWGRDHKSNDA